MSDKHATLYDFRDLDLMMKIRAETNGHGGVSSADLGDLLGFDGDNRPIGARMGAMRRIGIVLFDEKERTWRLSQAGERITTAHVRARSISVVEKMPDEKMVDVMAHVTSRWRHGDPVLAQVLRREFLFGTQRR